FEGDARSVRQYESLFIPGLLQTEEYARAVIRGVWPEGPDADIERRVEVRIQRQTVLQRPNPLLLWSVVDEAAFTRTVADKEVMRRQIEALVARTDEPNVTLQVIPFSAGAHPGMPGSFVVMDFEDAADQELVYLDSMGGDWFLERRTDIERFVDI